MRKSWPFALAVIVVGAFAGLAIAGRPVPSDTFVLDPSITVPLETTSTSVVSATTSIGEPATSTTSLATTTSTVSASTSVASTTAAVPTTAVPTTSDAPTTSTIPGPLPRNKVRLVLANGDGRFKLASVTADRIRSLGYIIDLGDTVNLVDATVLYYRPGFDDEAAIAANDIGVPDAIIVAFPTNSSQPITNSDGGGDVIVVLGPDAPR
ncbi:MAG: LytR C-terminal domain-containing protein [Ilumatobacteraceae bacterium]